MKRPPFPYSTLVSNAFFHALSFSAILYNFYSFFSTNKNSIFYSPLYFFFGNFLSDCISAIIHWGTEGWSSTLGSDYSIKKKFILNEHHTDVLNYSFVNFWESVGSGYFFNIPFIFLILLIEKGSPFHGILSFTLVFNTLFFFSHRWSHEISSGVCTLPKFWKSVIIFLQKTRILLEAKPHNTHHYYNTDSNYGVLNGNSNFLMNVLFKILPKFEYFSNERKRVMMKLLFLRKLAFQRKGSIYVKEIDDDIQIGEEYPSEKGFDSLISEYSESVR